MRLGESAVRDSEIHRPSAGLRIDRCATRPNRQSRPRNSDIDGGALMGCPRDRDQVGNRIAASMKGDKTLNDDSTGHGRPPSLPAMSRGGENVVLSTSPVISSVGS